MTFSNTKPDAGPSPQIDVVQLQTNFDQYQTIFSVNHTPLNDKNQGDHEAVVITQRATNPDSVESEDILFAKSVGGQPQLFIQLPTFLPNVHDTTKGPFFPIQMTKSTVNTAGPVYQSFLPGGYYLYCGSTTDISVAITLSPAPTKILIAIATPNNKTTTGTPIPYNVSTKILTASTFKINSTLNGGGPVVPYSFGWIAIGSS